MTSGDIIQAAFKVWGQELYCNTSLSQVSRELGVSKPALYRHFRNKQALLDAMYETFFDDYASFIRPYHEKAVSAASYQDFLRILLPAMIKYYAKNAYAFVFSLINVWENRQLSTMGEPLLKRGIDMGLLDCPQKEEPWASLWLLSVATLVFAMAYFHRKAYPAGEVPSDALIDRFIASVNCIISNGLDFDPAVAEGMDYGKLESIVAKAIQQVEEDPLLRGVAEAVAEKGPWKTSMEMAARYSGLSKSGLYAHFKSKEEMIGQLFRSEFDRIVDFVLENQRNSAVPGERLYLGVFSIAAYFRSQPNILLAMDWLRTRRVHPEKFTIPGRERQIFQDIRFPAEYGELPGDEGYWISYWIVFLVLKILMNDVFKACGVLFPQWGQDTQLSPENFARIPNESFRVLYRFITSGIKGFCTWKDGIICQTKTANGGKQ
jgi:AcrR family transcriptional regulator